MSIARKVLRQVAGKAWRAVNEEGRALPEASFWPIYAFERARSLGFTAESLVMNGLGWLVPGGSVPIPRANPQLQAEVRERYLGVLEEDAKNIQEGVYPLSVLEPELPMTHLGRLPKILWDGVQISRRRARGETAKFEAEAASRLEGVPRYFRRNFHFQTDGYLSERSAELYDHQVEVLFGGTADPMRRLCLKPLKRELRGVKAPQILELACGAGTATRFLAQTFPHAQILATDLSVPYVKVARERLKSSEHVQFLQCNAEVLPFREGAFDAVTSVFLFHELPEEARRQVVRESFRVLKPGGVVSFVDSAQTSDLPHFSELLELFPQFFHEPFYRNYQAIPLESLVVEAGFSELETHLGFLSKCVSARRPA